MTQDYPSTFSFHDCVTIFGDYWTLLIISTLLNSQPLRFCELQRVVDGISPTTLSARLKKLESYGIVERSHETVDKISVCYNLSEKGMSMQPVIEEITRYGKKYFMDCS